MNIEQYFDEIQEYIKTKIEQPNELDLIIKELDKDNIQAVVNQDFNDNVSIEDCAEKLLKATEVKGGIDVTEAPVLNGDRALNTMERKVLSYKDFINEKKSDRHCKKCNIIIVQGVNSSNDSDFCSNCKF